MHHGYYLRLARSVSERSTCVRAQVGAVLVHEDVVLSVGFNGAPRRQEHCRAGECAVLHGHCIRCVHAETNALLFTTRARGSLLYSTHMPCIFCCQHLINFGVSMVYWLKEYTDVRVQLLGFPTQQAYLEAAGVTVHHLEDEL